MAGKIEKLYARMPVLIQHAMVSAFGLYWHRRRFGKNFEIAAADFRRREHYTSDEWKTYAQQQLREVLLQAYSLVPFYREHWRGAVTQQQLEKFSLADMESLPPLEKSALRANPEAFLINGKQQSQHRIYHTSGSSGTPIATYWLPEEQSRSLALRHTRYTSLAGVGYDRPRATFSGRIVEPNPSSRGPYYRYNLVERQVYFSAFHLGPHTVNQYIEALKRHKIEWLTGYSNSIYQLAQLTLDRGLPSPTLKAVITTSEKLTPEMRRIIGTAFHSPVYEEYGSVENLFFACDNKFEQMLVSPDCGLIEIVDKNMKRVDTGDLGEVLATGFTRTSQPLIRYRIGDLAAFSDEKPLCGRNMPILREVVGRVEETVYGLDGRRIMRFHGIFVNQPHVQEGQVIQEHLDLIRVKIVPKEGYSQIDEMDIVARVRQRLTSHMNVIVEPVKEIPRTKNGKFRGVICNLSAEEKSQVGAK